MIRPSDSLSGIPGPGTVAKPHLVYYALVPGEPVQGQVTAFKAEAGRRFGSVKALRSPAHLTLIPPLRVDNAALAQWDGLVRDLTESFAPMRLICHGFAAFPPRVIYVKVHEHDALNRLHARLRERLYRSGMTEDQEWSPFHPHMTVAFRDLSPGQFAEAWPYFQAISYEAEWQADGVWRLIHRGDHWEQQVFFPFRAAQNDPGNTFP